MDNKNKELPKDEKSIAKGATNANRPAFPSDFEYGDEDFLGAPVIVHKTSFGLTKREYFAAMAMQGLLANRSRKSLFISPNQDEEYIIYDALATDAIRIADELLKQL